MLKPGLRADLNVIDFDRLATPAPYMAYDLPDNAQRFMQRPVGYRQHDLAPARSPSRTTS